MYVSIYVCMYIQVPASSLASSLVVVVLLLKAGVFNKSATSTKGLGASEAIISR